MRRRAFTLFEIIFMIVIIWFTAWISSAIARETDMALFWSSGLVATVLVTIMQLVGFIIRTAARDKESDPNDQ